MQQDKKPKKVSFNVPSKKWPETIKSSKLTATEQKIYYKLSLEYHVVLEESATFQMAAYNWSQILPSRLEKYNLTQEEWERISQIGDKSEKMQNHLQKLIMNLENDQIKSN